jgi:hypothetical protein
MGHPAWAGNRVSGQPSVQRSSLGSPNRRLETASGDHDVRLAWQDGAHTVPELRTQLGLLVGCPFRDPTTNRPVS